MHTLLLTFTCCWWDAYTDKILKGDDTGQEAAIFRPYFSYGLSPASVHYDCQGKAMQHRVEIHALANDVHRQKETYLKQEIKRIDGTGQHETLVKIHRVISAYEGTELL